MKRLNRAPSFREKFALLYTDLQSMSGSRMNPNLTQRLYLKSVPRRRKLDWTRIIQFQLESSQ